ncbi:metallophosphoesterase family protein [Schaedlerella sp.]|uniref:metallophosphoesterase family protein n=1 Tax=Schaedlerella sp. TaxID=2676057 RepID=UPI003744D719
MDGHRIGVISDTHGILRPETAEILKTCETILHAGDVGKPEVLRQLRDIRDTYAVRGNVDSGRIREFYARETERRKCAEDVKICTKEFEASRAGGFEAQAGGFEAGQAELPEHLPEELEIELFGFRIYMIHDKKLIRKDLPGVDLIICGHSHKYEVGRLGNTACLNPGSCGPRRFCLPVTMMLLTLYPAEHRMETERIDCLDIPAMGKGTSHGENPVWISEEGKAAGVHEEPAVRTGQRGAAKAPGKIKIPEQDMYRMVRQIMKEVDAGRRIAEIAARNHIDERFAEQVCRMYLTHPGVDVDGILDRMERKNL